ncbi:hypothetical protein [Tardiphaga alba]|uniref:hypothetical protein n=1 Tax=Tardiphaga alba TaxID=340268 RepID=UPI001BA75860|nr:hypothetical protein [Tardiphaga alba]
MTLLDIAVILWPLICTILMIAIVRYESPKLRAETARAREAERKARDPAPHATR